MIEFSPPAIKIIHIEVPLRFNSSYEQIALPYCITQLRTLVIRN